MNRAHGLALLILFGWGLYRVYKQITCKPLSYCFLSRWNDKVLKIEEQEADENERQFCHNVKKQVHSVRKATWMFEYWVLHFRQLQESLSVEEMIAAVSMWFRIGVHIPRAYSVLFRSRSFLNTNDKNDKCYLVFALASQAAIWSLYPFMYIAFRALVVCTPENAHHMRVLSTLYITRQPNKPMTCLELLWDHIFEMREHEPEAIRPRTSLQTKTSHMLRISIAELCDLYALQRQLNIHIQKKTLLKNVCRYNV
jgi:hypothetical protein